MKKIIAMLTLTLVASSAMAATGVLDDCAANAKAAATIFQTQIVGEMGVSTADVISQSEQAEMLQYTVETVNANGTRVRETVVQTDTHCNVQSVSRQE